MNKKLTLLLILVLSLSHFGFFGGNKKDWKENVRTIGVRIHMKAPELKVYYARNKALGLARNDSKLKEKDQNTSDRMMLALSDFSFSEEIFNELKKYLERYSDFKVIKEEEFSKIPPDFIFDVNVLNYGLVQNGIDPLPKALFQWEVCGRYPNREKPVWVVNKRKLSHGKNLRSWFLNKADALKGEFRAHIYFSVNDLMYNIHIRKRKMGMPVEKS